MIQFAPSEIALIQLFEGSIPIDNDVAPVVVLSEIKVPPAEAIETEKGFSNQKKIMEI